MFFFVVSFFSFILLSKSFLWSVPSWKGEMIVFSMPQFLGELSRSFLLWFKRNEVSVGFFQVPIAKQSVREAIISSREENAAEEQEEVCLLDLPALVLECILERLSPAGLCSMAGVCTSLRELCTSDHLWERHMKEKWGRVVGVSAYREWQWHIASTCRKRSTLLSCGRSKGLFKYLPNFWPFSSDTSEAGTGSNSEARASLPVDSFMAWYLAIHSGNFWFPAQVFNREVQNGNIGFMLSCYDAELSYDSHTDTFRARYPANGRRTIEENIDWSRLRAPAVDTPAHVLHVSDCLHDLKPGDHIEIQWRKSKEFPYGWWYGVVGHLESCSGSSFRCHCDSSDTVLLEFKHYSPGSRWRQTEISRKDHREVGNEADGFYAGIRKLYREEEISTWKRLWPAHALE